MSLTADQWYAKISKFVPSWYFEDKELSVCFTRGTFKAIAAVFAAVSTDTDDQQDETFIMDSDAPFLDLHGDERSFPRTIGESDATYRPEVRDSLFRPVGAEFIQAQVNAQLNNGVGQFYENYKNGFLDDAFFSDDDVSRTVAGAKWYDWWTVIIPVQTGGDLAQIKANVISVIETNKALGTTYDILWHDAADTDTGD